MPDFARVAKAFEDFIPYCRGASPLYERLSSEITHNQDVLALAAEAPNPALVPNLLFAAVRFLLLKGYGSGGVAEFQSIDAFREFCLTHADAIRELFQTRRVQTNEVARCAYLFPAFAFATSSFERKPLALIEVGTSAGLLLNWDRYGYRYDGISAGDSGSPVQITCELRGEKRLPRPSRIPLVASKLGIDLNPIDLQNDDEVLWLQSLVWPEQENRAALLASAIELARKYPVMLRQGDALEILPEIIHDVSAEATPCVFHTAVLYQMPAEDRQRFTQILEQSGAQRDLIWISGDLLPFVHVGVTSWRGAQMTHNVVAHAHHHGQWLEWLK